MLLDGSQAYTHLSLTGQGRPGDAERHCCMGAVYRDRCSCWRSTYDRGQAPLKTDLQPVVRDGMCHDCACRKDSPERADGTLTRVLARAHTGDVPFFCHEGMRRRIGAEHPDGSVHEEDPTDKYGPPVVDGVAYQADGTPAMICAGFAAAAQRSGGQQS